MLTLIEAISLAGDRAKQNDDACGAADTRAWVIDGATDLHSDPVMGAASDAAWLARELNNWLYAHHKQDLRAALRDAAHWLGQAYSERGRADAPAWRKPAASVVLMKETAEGLEAVDLGDSRLFVLDANAVGAALGGGGESAAAETQQARAVIGEARAAAPLSRAEVLEELRKRHEQRNVEGGFWVFGCDPACAAHARAHALNLARPAHVLLATDGFAALADRYQAYDAAALVRAALEKGLQELGRELRVIEDEDAHGARHARWKKNDDATALLLRLS